MYLYNIELRRARPRWLSHYESKVLSLIFRPFITESPQLGMEVSYSPPKVCMPAQSGAARR